jgi:hypothetical protein
MNDTLGAKGMSLRTAETRRKTFFLLRAPAFPRCASAEQLRETGPGVHVRRMGGA